MKTIYLSLFLILFAGSSVQAQKEVKTIDIHVDGVCGMCKTRIENALDVKGIKAADWSPENHTAKVVYRTDKISEEEIYALLHKAGHDTDKGKASDEAYSNIHQCCKYRDMTNH